MTGNKVNYKADKICRICYSWIWLAVNNDHMILSHEKLIPRKDNDSHHLYKTSSFVSSRRCYLTLLQRKSSNLVEEHIFNSLPCDEILAPLERTAFAQDKWKVNETTELFLENIVGKWENADYQLFPIYSQ